MAKSKIVNLEANRKNIARIYEHTRSEEERRKIKGLLFLNEIAKDEHTMKSIKLKIKKML